MTVSPARTPGQLKPMFPVIGVLHPGQMGAAVAGCLRSRGATVLWCAEGRSRDSARRAKEADLLPVRRFDELIDRSDVILSICPPTAAESVARDVAEQGYRGLFVEANAISPVRYLRIAAILAGSGATVVDGSLIGAPPSLQSRPRLYLSGHLVAARKVANLFAETAMEVVVLGEEPAAASALKMAHASFSKAVRPLAAVAHALAADYAVTDHLLAEAEREPRSALAELDLLPIVAARAARAAPEVAEAADALAAAELPPQLAQAAHHVLDQWARGKYRPGTPLEVVLHGLRDGQPEADHDSLAADAGPEAGSLHESGAESATAVSGPAHA